MEKFWFEQPSALVMDGLERCADCGRPLVGQEDRLCTPCISRLEDDASDQLHIIDMAEDVPIFTVNLAVIRLQEIKDKIGEKGWRRFREAMT